MLNGKDSQSFTLMSVQIPRLCGDKASLLYCSEWKSSRQPCGNPPPPSSLFCVSVCVGVVAVGAGGVVAAAALLVLFRCR